MKKILFIIFLCLVIFLLFYSYSCKKIENKDIVIVAIASRNERYDLFLKHFWIPFIKYVNKTHTNVKVYLVFGKGTDVGDLKDIRNNILVSPSPENYKPGILKKTIFAFKHIMKNHNPSYVFRTNLSSVIILENFLDHVNGLSSRDVYNGLLYKSEKINTDFVSGSGFVLSNDVVKFILDNESNLDYDIIDDVSIGKLLTDNGYKITKGRRYDKTSSFESIPTEKDIQTMADEIKKDKHYHIRIRNKNWEPEIDGYIVKNLYKYLFL